MDPTSPNSSNDPNLPICSASVFPIADKPPNKTLVPMSWRSKLYVANHLNFNQT